MRKSGKHGSMTEGEKTYVEVIALFDLMGRITPLSLVWTDGRRFDITRAGGGVSMPPLGGSLFPVRYECRICGESKMLYHESDTGRWFVYAVR